MRTYVLSVVDLTIIFGSLTLEGISQASGLALGAVVAVLTIYKLIQDIRINKKKLKE